MQKKNDIYVELIQLAMHLKYGYPSLNSISYNADKQIFEGELRSHSGGFNQHIEIPVDLKHAEKFKPFLIEKASNPSIDFRVIHDKLVFAGVSGLESPSLIVEKDALGHAHSSEELRAFINEYPDSSLVAEAKDRISINEKRYKEGLEKSKLAQQQDEIDKNRKASSYAAQKQIGDKVCLDYSGLFGGGVIKGFVEGKNGNKIQVRITDGYSLHSDYETGRIIWSGYDSWRYCSY